MQILVAYCVKSVRIRSFSGRYFPTFGLNTERYGVSLYIRSECGKIGTRKTPNMDTFHAVADAYGGQFFFSEVIRENLVTIFNSQGVWGSVAPKDFGQNAIQMQEYNMQFSLTLFGVIHKRIVTLTTVTDSLKNVLNQLFFPKVCLLFHVRKVRTVSKSEDC